MNILVVGKGGREHAVGWKLSNSPKIKRLYFMPGNAGTLSLGENINIDPINHEKVLLFCKQNSIALAVIGPDEYLAQGLTDSLTQGGIGVFGPTKAAAQIEWSKAYAKEFMEKNGIPTAEYRKFTDSIEAVGYLEEASFPIVIKADGLALGKGVVIANNHEEAQKAVVSMLDKNIFGEAGNTIVIEEYLQGKEISVHAFCDGEHATLFPASQDHKRRFENDEGPNTGGMGVVAPVPWITSDDLDRIKHDIINPVLKGLREGGTPFVGILFPGIMLTDQGPKVIEFNARFGDPETQSYMPLLETDLLDIMLACVEGKLDKQSVTWNTKFACGVALVSKGYPGPYKTGMPIGELSSVAEKESLIFHAGTMEKQGKVLTAGGRVLNIVSVGESMAEAIAKTYTIVEKVDFEGKEYRSDIGTKTLNES